MRVKRRIGSVGFGDRLVLPFRLTGVFCRDQKGIRRARRKKTEIPQTPVQTKLQVMGLREKIVILPL